MRIPERVSKGRARVTEATIRNWFLKLSNYLDEIGQSSILEDPNRIFNSDEMYDDVYEVAAGPEKTSLTVFGTFCANGEIVKPTVIYPYKRIPNDVIQNIPESISHLKTQSGWMRSDAFYDFVTGIFNDYLVEKNVQKPVILFLDGHSSHTSMQLSIEADNLGIILYRLQPNSTHIMQPADVGPFKPLKDFWKSKVHEFQNKNPNVSVSKKDVAPLVKTALDQIKKKTVQNAFRVCGIYPFNADKVDYTKCVEIELIDDSNELEEAEAITTEEYRNCVKVLKKELGPMKSHYCENQVGLEVTDLYRLYATITYKANDKKSASTSSDRTNGKRSPQPTTTSNLKENDNAPRSPHPTSTCYLDKNNNAPRSPQPTSTCYLDKNNNVPMSPQPSLTCYLDDTNAEIFLEPISTSNLEINCPPKSPQIQAMLNLQVDNCLSSIPEDIELNQSYYITTDPSDNESLVLTSNNSSQSFVIINDPANPNAVIFSNDTTKAQTFVITPSGAECVQPVLSAEEDNTTLINDNVASNFSKGREAPDDDPNYQPSTSSSVQILENPSQNIISSNNPNVCIVPVISVLQENTPLNNDNTASQFSKGQESLDDDLNSHFIKL